MAIAGASPRADAQLEGTALDRAEAFVASLRSFRAHVVQRYHDRLHDRDLEIAGELALTRPDRFTLRFTDGRGLAVSGSSAVALEPDAALVHERTLADDAYLELRGLLAGTTTLAAAFDVRELGARSSGDVLELRPRVRSLWDRAFVSVQADGTPTRLLVVDAAGNSLRWVLTRAVSSARPSSGVLGLPVPADAEHVAP